VSMFDDLDPDFISSPGPALPLVAARVHAVRKRRMVVAGSVCGAVVVALLASTAFGGGGDNNRVTVAQETTTTVDDTSTTEAPLLTVPTSSTSTSTTVAATSTTVTLPVETTTTAPETTTTTRLPAHITVAFDRDRLVIRSGTTATFSYTVTNDGEGPGEFPAPSCPDKSLWPYQLVNFGPFDSPDYQPVPWPEPADLPVYCAALTVLRLPPHTSHTVRVHVGGGHYDRSGNLVPAPPGTTSYKVQDGPGSPTLPVTITPPASLPLTVDHPSEVTTGSNEQHVIDFTITNHLPFLVRYTDQGPCSMDTATPCRPTTEDGAWSGDMRLYPYATAVKPLYLTRFLLGANETKVAHAMVHGTTNLEDIFLGSPAMPPGVYRFAWDGEKVKFTVTP
jgi:hypothetical protein